MYIYIKYLMDIENSFYMYTRKSIFSIQSYLSVHSIIEIQFFDVIQHYLSLTLLSKLTVPIKACFNIKSAKKEDTVFDSNLIYTSCIYFCTNYVGIIPLLNLKAVETFSS